MQPSELLAHKIDGNLELKYFMKIVAFNVNIQTNWTFAWPWHASEMCLIQLHW